MSLNWNWKNVVGEISLDNPNHPEADKHRIFIYEGNAFLIFIGECKETYNLYNFFVDQRHAENCLGLHPKEYDGCSSWIHGKTLTLSSRSRNCRKFVELLFKAHIPCIINLVDEYSSYVHREWHNNYVFGPEDD